MKKPWFKIWYVWVIGGIVFIFLVAVTVFAVMINNINTTTYEPPKKERLNTYEIEIGMTTTEVKAVWGLPTDTTQTKTEYANYESYTYVDDFNNYFVVEFEDGKVTSVGEY